VNWLHTNTMQSAELAGEFKTNQCSKAVAEEGKRLVEEWK
jgi:hypothetical protein